GKPPGRFDSALQLLDAHLRRLKDHVLAVVQLPVARQDSSFLLESLEQRRAGERRDGGEARQVDACVDDEAGGLEKDRRRVLIQPEDEASLQRDAVAVERVDEGAIL